MRKLHLTWDVILALVVLLLSAYIAFLGLLYRENGTLAKALATSIGLILTIGLCIYGMSAAKSHRNHKLSLIGQIGLGALIVIVFLAASIPFTNFLSVWQHQGQVAEQTQNVKYAARDMDKAYNEYAAGRIDSYRPTDTLRRASLRRHLLPAGIDSVQAERGEWMESIGDMKPWNIALPSNLNTLKGCTDNWVGQYQKLASLKFTDEIDPADFTYSKFGDELNTLLNDLRQPKFSFLALFISLVAAFFMFLPYLFMRSVARPKTDDLWETYYEQHKR